MWRPLGGGARRVRSAWSASLACRGLKRRWSATSAAGAGAGGGRGLQGAGSVCLACGTGADDTGPVLAGSGRHGGRTGSAVASRRRRGGRFRCPRLWLCGLSQRRVTRPSGGDDLRSAKVASGWLRSGAARWDGAMAAPPSVRVPGWARAVPWVWMLWAKVLAASHADGDGGGTFGCRSPRWGHHF
jgi:hypothetical protein